MVDIEATVIAPEIQNAIKLFVEGNYLEALPVLQGAADKGDVEASLACAKVFCYQNQWHEAGMYASKMVLSFKHQTDFDLLLDSWRLVTLSGICTGDWQLADYVVAKCENHYDKKYDKKPTKKSETISARAKAKSHPRLTYYRAFKKLIKRRGAGAIAYPVFPEPSEARKDRFLKFRRAKKRILTSHISQQSGKNFSGYWGQKTIDDEYKEAVDCSLSEKCLQFYHETGRYPNNHFALLDLALAFLDSNDRRRASYALRRSIQTYEPASSYDLLPVTLFWIPEIREFLTPSRTEKLLQLKRDDGPARSYKFIARENMADVKNSRFIATVLCHRVDQAVASEIVRWEANISGNPTDLLLRLMLCDYYEDTQFFSAYCRASLARHIFWFIENQPDIKGLASFQIYTSSGPSRGQQEAYDPRLYNKGKRLWLQQLELNPESKVVCLNASSYFFLENIDLSEKVLWSALEHNPGDAEILDRIYFVLSAQFRDSFHSDSGKDICERMLSALKQLIPTNFDSYNSHRLLPAAAWCAVEVEMYDEAKSYANLGIRSLTQQGDKPLSAYIKEHGDEPRSICYSVLGKVALAEGQRRAALKYLDKAIQEIEDDVNCRSAAAMNFASELARSNKEDVLKILRKYLDKTRGNSKEALGHYISVIKKGGKLSDHKDYPSLPRLS
ncbi:MAG TPA: hypothetical protein PKD05_01790 [Candidatus Melainabacteria bacterium]|nr:hypothetical protein [Candidatus Melainabacteria bacterium]